MIVPFFFTLDDGSRMEIRVKLAEVGPSQLPHRF